MGVNTYVAVGNRLDLSDIITNIAPSETPLYSTLGKASATATYHEWLEDDLGEPGANKQVEGFEYTTEAGGTRTRLGNYTQIMHRGYHVTDTQEVVLKHGVKSEIAYQMAKAMKLIALDMEYAILNNATKVAGSLDQGSEVAREFGGIPYWITTNVKKNIVGETPTPRPLTLDLINELLEDVWNKGGAPNTLFVSARNKRIIGTFTDSATKYMEEGTTRIGSRIDVIETDFGTLNIKVNRWMGNDAIYAIDPSLWKIAALRPFKTMDLPKTGDKIKKVIVGEHTLEARAEYGNGAITDLDGVMPTI